MLSNLLGLYKIRLILIKWFYSKILSKKCGVEIPWSGKEGEKTNCYVLYLGDEEDRLSYLIESIDFEKNEIHVKSVDANACYSITNTINLQILFTHKIRTLHFYKTHKLIYNSLISLFLNYVTKFEMIRVNLTIFCNFLIQSRFNRKAIISHKKIDILQTILNKYLDQKIIHDYTQNEEGISVFDLMTALNTERWLDHPEGKKKKAELGLYLESLVDSGDLNKNGRGYYYIIKGKALQTIEHYETEERRHNDSVNTQFYMVILTFIIAWATVLQVVKS